eukprot:126404-Alexandrium_andersonii.AAC.1
MGPRPWVTSCSNAKGACATTSHLRENSSRACQRRIICGCWGGVRSGLVVPCPEEERRTPLETARSGHGSAV